MKGSTCLFLIAAAVAVGQIFGEPEITEDTAVIAMVVALAAHWICKAIENQTTAQDRE